MDKTKENFNLLPQPTQVVWNREDEDREAKLRQRSVSAIVSAPPCARCLQQVHINADFATRTEASYVSGRKARREERKARNAITMRAQLRRKLARIQKEKEEEKFVALLADLDIVERKLKDSIEMRAQLQKKLAQMEKEEKERHLRKLAKEVRIEREILKAAVKLNIEVVRVRKIREQLRVEQQKKERTRQRYLKMHVPDKEFIGTDRTAAARSGPVQFETEENPFGLDLDLDLDVLLKQAEKATRTTTAGKKDDPGKRRKY